MNPRGRTRRLPGAWAAWFACAWAACRAPVPPVPPVPPGPPVSAAPAGPPDPRGANLESPSTLCVPAWQTIGFSVEGRAIEYAVFGAGPRTLLLLASIHGDENAGTPLLLRCADELSASPAWLARARVVVAPAVNPDGVAHGRRQNAHGVDLNRDFPAANRRAEGSAASREPETLAIRALVERFEPAAILSFHQPVGVLDYDGPATDLVELLIAVSPLPVQRLGARPGSLGSWAGVDRRIPVVTVELRRDDDQRSPDELWQRYGPMLVEAARWVAATPAD